MNEQSTANKSRLVGALREGVALVQMVFFKEIKGLLDKKYPDEETTSHLMLAGAITNELFGTPNPEPQFIEYRREHRTQIEDELAGLADSLPHLRTYLTDALRVQALCDDQEGIEDPGVLQAADTLGILVEERQLPLPSAFMTLVRGLGEQYELIVAPVQISPEEDQSLLH